MSCSTTTPSYMLDGAPPLNLRKRIGVYAILNNINGKYYIGSTNDMHTRFKMHRLALRHNKHANGHLQFSYNKHGESKFRFVVLGSGTYGEAKAMEQRYLDSMSPQMYNLSNSAYGGPLGPMKESTKQKIRDAWSPDRRAKWADFKRGVKAHPNTLAGVISAHSHSFDVVSPSGQRHTGKNIAQFCRDNAGLKAQTFGRMLLGKQSAYKGWRKFS